jgi:hypothetical protein
MICSSFTCSSPQNPPPPPPLRTIFPAFAEQHDGTSRATLAPPPKRPPGPLQDAKSHLAHHSHTSSTCNEQGLFPA